MIKNKVEVNRKDPLHLSHQNKVFLKRNQQKNQGIEPFFVKQRTKRNKEPSYIYQSPKEKKEPVNKKEQPKQRSGETAKTTSTRARSTLNATFYTDNDSLANLWV